MNRSGQISRRTVLRGIGTALSLPLLECMIPRVALGSDASFSPRRMVFFYVPNGMHMPDWTPSAVGELKELPKTLEPLANHKSNITVLSGLTLDGGRSHGDGPGDHARSVASYLTGAHPTKTEGENIRNGVSVDQFAAEQIGGQTRFPSLELGCEPSAQSGNCDSGYSCIYTSNMSWRSEINPMAKEIHPRLVFDRLFGGGSADDQERSRQIRDAQRRSILDFAAEDARALDRKLGATDRRKLDEYLYAVREIERRIESTETLESFELEVPDTPRPPGTPRDFGEHIKLMMDMIVLALQTDSTRIVTMMFTNAGSNRSYPDQGVREQHHHLSHHGNDEEKLTKISTINRYHVSLLAYFLDRLAAVDLDGRTLLDQSMVVYGSGIGDGNRHNHDNLPILLAGRGGDTIAPGRHLRYSEETPLTNLYLSLLHGMGVEADAFSDSTGPLSDLAG